MDGQARLSTQMKSSVDFHQLLKKKKMIKWLRPVQIEEK